MASRFVAGQPVIICYPTGKKKVGMITMVLESIDPDSREYTYFVEYQATVGSKTVHRGKGNSPEVWERTELEFAEDWLIPLDEVAKLLYL